jgi:GNAT superfamily N-acetyltransferase
VLDIPALVGLAEAMHAEGSFAGMNFTPEILAAYLAQSILQGQFVVVAEKNGEIIGAFVGFTFQSIFGRDYIAADDGLFIAKEHRGGRLAIKLIQAFVEWARAQGVKQIRPGVSTGEAGAAAERLYERLGFQRVGTLFMMLAQ